LPTSLRHSGPRPDLPGRHSWLENYPGFPQGISGADLAAAIHEQAIRFGAEILIGVELSQVEPGHTPVRLRVAQRLRLPNPHTAVVAPGVHYRRLDAPGIERLVGSGVYYGSACGCREVRSGLSPELARGRATSNRASRIGASGYVSFTRAREYQITPSLARVG
jgi:hypothetical protein